MGPRPVDRSWRLWLQAYAGHHARYVLRTPVTVIEMQEAA